MIKQYNVTVNGTTYEVTVESAAGGRMDPLPSPALPRLLLPALPLRLLSPLPRPLRLPPLWRPLPLLLPLRLPPPPLPPRPLWPPVRLP